MEDYQQKSMYENQDSNYQTQSPVSNYLVPNIIATVIGFLTCWWCCISGFVGIPGIIFSTQSKNKFEKGDIAGSIKDAKTAKILMIISFSITASAFVYFIARIIILVSTGELESTIEEARRMIESGSY